MITFFFFPSEQRANISDKRNKSCTKMTIAVAQSKIYRLFIINKNTRDDGV